MSISAKSRVSIHFPRSSRRMTFPRSFFTFSIIERVSLILIYSGLVCEIGFIGFKIIDFWRRLPYSLIGSEKCLKPSVTARMVSMMNVWESTICRIWKEGIKDWFLGKLILSYIKAKNSQKILTVACFFIQSRTLATIAQLVEHRFCKPTVISSSLIGGSTSVKFEVRLNIWVGSRVVKWGGL